MAANATKSDSYAWIIRTLAVCRREADKMELADLSRLLNMAIFQAALDWESQDPGGNSDDDHLEHLLRLKMKLAYSESDENIVVLSPKTAGEV